MLYDTPVVHKARDKLIIEIDLSMPGEMSRSGRAQNLVDPRPRYDYEDGQDSLGIRLTVCRPLQLRGPR